MTCDTFKLLAAAAAGVALAALCFHKCDGKSLCCRRVCCKKRAPVKVMVSGAAGQIGYSLLPLIASGQALGPNQEVILHLLDIAPALGALGGVKMELEDGAYPLVRDVVITSDATVALNDVDVAIFVGGFPRGPGMERKDLISKNSKIFVEQGAALDKFAKKSCKVLVVANPANTNCLILMKNAPSIPKENFTCLTRLDLNRAKFQIAAKANVKVQDVRNVAIWGNHSATQFPDAFNAKIKSSCCKSIAATEAINDNKWLTGEFVTTVQQRGKAIIEARKLSSAMSAANAIKDHIHTWLVSGTSCCDTTSMGIWSNGNPYGIQDGLIFSFPVKISKCGKVTIDKNFKIDTFAKERLLITEKELVEEAAEAEACLRG